MVAKDIRWIRLLDPENHNISWANHISHTNPGKRDKSDPSFKRQWSRLFHCAALVRPRAETDDAFITMAFDEDLDDAAKEALRQMIALIVERTNLSRPQAYALCSLAADLRVTQIVNGNKGIHVVLPKSAL